MKLSKDEMLALLVAAHIANFTDEKFRKDLENAAHKLHDEVFNGSGTNAR